MLKEYGQQAEIFISQLEMLETAGWRPMQPSRPLEGHD